jgi:hypothetical protein
MNTAVVTLELLLTACCPFVEVGNCQTDVFGPGEATSVK